MLVSCVPSAPMYNSLAENVYYVSTTGLDTNSGSISSPFQTINKALTVATAGSLIYVHGGTYTGISNSWRFANTGTSSQPITFANYPGEQVILRMLTGSGGHTLFQCWDHKSDYIKIIGTDVLPQILSNGVISTKGIVMQGSVGEQSAAISGYHCNNWEIAGVDFVDVAYGMFTFKDNNAGTVIKSTDYWYVHNNRVYGFYRESGMQFNGDNNTVENNEIYKVTSRTDTPYGCQGLNFLGDSNVIRNNIIDIRGSTVSCYGILFEWDLADNNLAEGNMIYGVRTGIDIEGGDNNTIQFNSIYVKIPLNQWAGGIEIHSYDGVTSWPCDETVGSARALLPPNDPTHPDYLNYYNPRNCHSRNNKVLNNTIYGFVEGIRLYALIGEGTVVKNNIFAGWTRGGLCYYNVAGTCMTLNSNIVQNNNVSTGAVFVDVNNGDLHLVSGSPLCTAGEGGTYVGAFPCSMAIIITPTKTQTSTQTFTRTNTVTASVTNTPTPSQTNTLTSTVTASNTPTATDTLTSTPTNTSTVTPSRTSTPTPTNTPTLECHKVNFLDGSIIFVCK